VYNLTAKPQFILPLCHLKTSFDILKSASKTTSKKLHKNQALILVVFKVDFSQKLLSKDMAKISCPFRLLNFY